MFLLTESRRRPKGTETNTPRFVGKEDQPYSHQIAEKPGNVSKLREYCCVINYDNKEEYPVTTSE